MNEQKMRDFKSFFERVNSSSLRAPTSRDSFRRWVWRGAAPTKAGFTLQEIEDIIRSGDHEALRELSRHFYRVSGIYRNNIDMLASLVLFYNVVSPVYNPDKLINRAQILEDFYKACTFIERLNVSVNFPRILREQLITGIYYGILREDEEGRLTIQDLPIEYCRTRFKDYNNLNILEFSLHYFDTIPEKADREEALAAFPSFVAAAYESGNFSYPWVEITPENGGVCFFYGDRTPLLIASIPAIQELSDSIERESRRDENELYKLLIQKMPIDSDNELVFDTDEAYDIHASVARMLESLDTIDVLTTFGDVKLENVQDSTAASQSSDRIEKYKDNAYDSLGRSSLLFNATGTSSLNYSVQRDEALMFSIIQEYEAWVKYQINLRFAHRGRAPYSFDFTILPISFFNQDKIQKQYFQGAQYGYSKMFAGAALGIEQMEQLSLMSFEKDILNMSEKMEPLRSTYTTSEKDRAAENLAKAPNTSGITNEAGRPSLEETAVSQKTEANRASDV